MNRTTEQILNDIDLDYLADEQAVVQNLIRQAGLNKSAQAEIVQQARKFVNAIREAEKKEHGLDAFMAEYDLSSRRLLSYRGVSMIADETGKTVQVAVSYDYSQQKLLLSSRSKAKVAGLGRN